MLMCIPKSINKCKTVLTRSELCQGCSPRLCNLIFHQNLFGLSLTFILQPNAYKAAFSRGGSVVGSVTG